MSNDSQKRVPFPMLSSEKMSMSNIDGSYNEKTQTLNCSCDLSGTSTFIETATGGYGDTDNTEDTD